MTTPDDFVELLANRGVSASSVALQYENMPAMRRVSGYPRVGRAVLAQVGDLEIGVWEITPSISTDIESDEIFVVLSGEGSVRFADGSPELALSPGTVGRLKQGTATTWTIERTLRKIYIA